MPHFTLGLEPSGAGPLLTAVIGVSEPRGGALVAASQPVPSPMPIRGLVDTGASNTCIDPSVLSALGLSPSGQTLCHSPTTGATPQTKHLYDVSLQINAGMNEPFLHFTTLPVMSSDLLQAQGIHVLIGRDVLAMCLLIYNGTVGQFTLGY